MPDKSYHHGDLKSQLIREGLKLLDKDGYDGFSLRKVAALCGVSQTAPYRHFKNKDELIAAITQHAMEAFGARLEEAVRMHPGDPNGQLREMGVLYIRFFAENPEYRRLLFFSDIQLRQHFADTVRQNCGEDGHTTDRSFGVLQETVARYKEAHPDEVMTQDELVLYCWGLVHGISTLITTGELPWNGTTMALAERVIWSNGFLR